MARGWRIVVVEAEHVGFGASGRNGGWLSGLLPGNRSGPGERGPGGRAGVVALQRHLIDAVGEVVGVCSAEGIDADIHLGGTLAVATPPRPSWTRLRLAWPRTGVGLAGPDDVWRTGAAGDGRPGAGERRGGGAVQPALRPGAAGEAGAGAGDAVERRGVEIFERSPALEIEPVLGPGGGGATASGAGPSATARGGRVRTPGGSRAGPAGWSGPTEGFTATVPGAHRRLLPMNSSMVVTEPLPPGLGRARLGRARDAARRRPRLRLRPAHRRRPDRHRGPGRPVPVRVPGRRVGPHARLDGRAAVRRPASALPGARAGVGIAHAWSGVLGVARDWCPAVGVDRRGGSGGLALGRGVRRGRGHHLLPGRAHPGRPDPRPGHVRGPPCRGSATPAGPGSPSRCAGSVFGGIYGLYRAADRAEARRPGGPARRGGRLSPIGSRGGM